MKKYITLLSLLSMIAGQIHGMNTEWQQQKEAFAMANHPRLGAKSPANVLPQELRHYILQLIQHAQIEEWKTKSWQECNKALLDAAKKGDANLVSILIAAGANKNAKTLAKLRPLHLAAAYGHLAAVKVLINAGAKINAQEKSKFTPLHLAV